MPALFLKSKRKVRGGKPIYCTQLQCPFVRSLQSADNKSWNKKRDAVADRSHGKANRAGKHTSLRDAGAAGHSGGSGLLSSFA